MREVCVSSVGFDAVEKIMLFVVVWRKNDEEGDSLQRLLHISANLGTFRARTYRSQLLWILFNRLRV